MHICRTRQRLFSSTLTTPVADDPSVVPKRLYAASPCPGLVECVLLIECVLLLGLPKRLYAASPCPGLVECVLLIECVLLLGLPKRLYAASPCPGLCVYMNAHTSSYTYVTSSYTYVVSMPLAPVQVYMCI